ncbi:MAG: hypothetical protein KAI17_02495, partial [Thiotrichaceae bacterium]|nr:hypothetical protein [Thiotrichaceae bacterium]
MKISNQQIGKNKQNGLVLLVLVIMIFLAVSSYYLTSISVTEIKVDNIKRTQFALKQAKQALLSYAVSRADLTAPSAQPGRYGFLPCPANISSTNNTGDGTSVGSCNASKLNTVGWFPWKSLSIQPLRDGNNDCLYYAVSGSYKTNPEAGMLNEDSYGMLQVVDADGVEMPGSADEDRVVAIIFSAGEATNSQTRDFLSGTECGYDNSANSSDPENYLDSLEVSPGDTVDNSDIEEITADSVDRFVNAPSIANEDVMNDRLITITRDEVWQVILARSDFDKKMENLTNALAMCLAAYANQADNSSRRLPWPVITNLSGADFREQDSYQDDDGATGGYSGRYPFNIRYSNDEIDEPNMTDDELLNTTGLCDALDIFGDASVIVDLRTTGSEYRELWNNWKDHFFYLLSRQYAPANSGKADCSASNDCIKIAPSNNKYAAAVIFSGRRLDSQSRSDKSLVSDYLEDGNSIEFTEEALLKA